MDKKLKIRKAQPQDCDSIYRLVKHYSDQEVILERSQDDIKSSIDTFFVALVNREVVGTISFHDYGKNLKEIRSLSVDSAYSGKGAGSRLVRAAVKHLNPEDSRIFVLTYLPEFFKRLGFLEISKDLLPEKIWKDCEYCKNKDTCGETALIITGGVS